MASVVGICNSALIKLGASTIVSLTEGSKNASLCGEQFEKARDELLRTHSWNFATTRAQLGRLAETPNFGFAYVFQLPSDWVRTISVHPDGAANAESAYKIEGRTVLSDAEIVYLRYVRRVTDPNDMDPLFREALAWKLAIDLAIPITQSNSTLQIVHEGFREAFARAKSVDAIEDFPDREPYGVWVDSRN